MALQDDPSAAADSAFDESSGIGRHFPLEDTVEALDRQFGLYLSPQQRKGLAAGMALGIVIGSAVLAWAVSGQLRERLG